MSEKNTVNKFAHEICKMKCVTCMFTFCSIDWHSDFLEPAITFPPQFFQPPNVIFEIFFMCVCVCIRRQFISYFQNEQYEDRQGWPKYFTQKTQDFFDTYFLVFFSFLNSPAPDLFGRNGNDSEWKRNKHGKCVTIHLNVAVHISSKLSH